jgi:hypothetical protein
MKTLIKYVMLSAGLLCGANHVHAQSASFELAQSFSKIARKYDTNLDWNAYALAYLQIEKRQRYASVMHDPALVQAEVTKLIPTLKAEAQSISPIFTVNFQCPARIGQSIDTMQMQCTFLRGRHTLDTMTQKPNSYIGSTYTLMIANANIASVFPVPHVAWQETTAHVEANDVQSLYVSVDFELANIRQHEYFNVIVRKARLYADAGRLKLLGEVVEKRDAKTLVDARWFSEGATLFAVPDHGFVVDGVNMNEILEQDDTSVACTSAPREHGHRVYLCRRELIAEGQSQGYTIHRFVGGRRVEVSVYASKAQAARPDAEILPRDAGRFVFNKAGIHQLNEGCCITTVYSKFRNDLSKPFYVATSKIYLDLKAGKAGTEVLP